MIKTKLLTSCASPKQKVYDEMIIKASLPFSFIALITKSSKKPIPRKWEITLEVGEELELDWRRRIKMKDKISLEKNEDMGTNSQHNFH